MQWLIGGGSRFGRRTRAGARFTRVSEQDSGTAQLLRGCPVMTADGRQIGAVGHLLADAVTCQLRYVVLAPEDASATVMIPWHSLYFDGALARLVFYTCEE
jgi:hypothetical protein